MTRLKATPNLGTAHKEFKHNHVCKYRLRFKPFKGLGKQSFQVLSVPMGAVTSLSSVSVYDSSKKFQDFPAALFK